MAMALDLTRRILSLPYKLDRIIDFDLFVMIATREAIKENVLHASAPHAPYVYYVVSLKSQLLMYCNDIKVTIKKIK